MFSGKARMIWHRQVQQWHWISAAVSLAALLLFSITGITLNHAGSIGSKPEITTLEGELSPGLLSALQSHGEDSKPRLPLPVVEWIDDELDMNAGRAAVEWSEDEVMVSSPGAGRDTWVSIDLATGEWLYENTWRGAIGWMNDLHKGRNTGGLWQAFIDLTAIACVIFAITGLFLLQLAARQRKSTWPLVGSGIGLLLVMMIFFAH